MTDSEIWLPTSVKELAARAWEQPDVILFSGDAYVDHPSFGAAVVGRLLESLGLKVAVVPQPNWRDDLRDFTKLGKPRLFFAISGGSMDSMVNHYTAARRKRSDDAYSPGGKAGFRPDYAVSVYGSIIKRLFPDVPLVIGGIEASLRRLSHYDYWSDTLKPSILVDSKADLLVYGMGESPLIEMVRLLKKGVPFSQLRTVRQTAFLAANRDELPTVKAFSDLELETHAACVRDPKKYAPLFKIIEQESNRVDAHRLIQPTEVSGDARVVINPPFELPTRKELDSWYDLPFTRLPHPRYNGKGAIPAWEMIRDSVTLHRGCWGGCSFCTISAHQGRHVVSRSKESILREVKQLVTLPGFGGQLSDLGGPSANMWSMERKDTQICTKCSRLSCMVPTMCPNLVIDHSPLIDLYRSVRKVEGLRKAVVSSGVRYDMFYDSDGSMRPESEVYAHELINHHVSGRLKVAPEHSDPEVLRLMRKPSFALFRRFAGFFAEVNQKASLKQELIPYFISSHPGSTAISMAELAIETKTLNFRPEQVQDLTPTPLTLASAIWYSGLDPASGERVFIERDPEAKLIQKLFFFWHQRENRARIEAVLRRFQRSDLAVRLFAEQSVDQSRSTNKARAGAPSAAPIRKGRHTKS